MIQLRQLAGGPADRETPALARTNPKETLNTYSRSVSSRRFHLIAIVLSGVSLDSIFPSMGRLRGWVIQKAQRNEKVALLA
jgi:hypothetical protein